jgi:4-hydroxy-2-oxoheptanedioate aldolase
MSRQDKINPARRRLKEKLARRGRILGVGVVYPSTGLAETLALSGVDLVFIDCEHAGPGVETVADMVRAVRAGGGASVLRPWSRDPGLIRRYLDCGVDGLIAPEIGTAGEAQAIADIIRTSDPPDAANLVLIPLIETIEGLKNVEAIWQIDGVDGVQVGPADLAVSFGLPRRGKPEIVTDTCLDLFARATAAGISSGGPVARFGSAAFVATGANILMVSVDELLAGGLSRFQAELAALGQAGEPA